MEPAFIARYRNCFETTWSDDTPVDQVRFVVLDCETTGLNPVTDRIITIGAVAMQDGEILLEDSFESLLKLSRNTASVTVHGVTRDESRAGIEEQQALETFLEYLKDGVIVGHHIGHDIASLDAGYERHWGFNLSNRWLDTVYLGQHLQSAGAFSNLPPISDWTLDALCGLFGIEPHDRHTAAGDAFLTAQALLRLRVLAMRHGRDRLGRFCEPVAF